MSGSWRIMVSLRAQESVVCGMPLLKYIVYCNMAMAAVQYYTVTLLYKTNTNTNKLGTLQVLQEAFQNG